MRVERDIECWSYVIIMTEHDRTVTVDGFAVMTLYPLAMLLLPYTMTMVERFYCRS